MNMEPGPSSAKLILALQLEVRMLSDELRLRSDTIRSKDAEIVRLRAEMAAMTAQPAPAAKHFPRRAMR